LSVPFRRPGRETYSIDIRTPGGVVRKSTGTRDKRTAVMVERELSILADRREWELVNAVVDNRLTLGDLSDAARTPRGLDALRARLNDIDLEPLVEEWKNRACHARQARHDQPLRPPRSNAAAAGVSLPRSEFTTRALNQWMARQPGSAGTRRKAHAAMSQFAKFLVRHEVIGSNPMREVQAPPPGRPRLRYFDVTRMMELANVQAEPYRTLSILLGGTGIEVSVATALRRGDVEVERKRIHAAGTKTHARDRIVRVAEWAWPAIAALCAGLADDDRLFPNTDRWRAGDAHRAACQKLGITDYHIHDQRHSYAVRAAKAGTPPEIIARQLGHANAILVHKVYGRFMPSAEECDRWEMIAAGRDAEQSEPREPATTTCCTIPCTVPRLPKKPSRVTR
jgi:integrase